MEALSPAEKKFEKAFIDCLRDGVHPGPTQLNKRIDPKRKFRIKGMRFLNGRESRQRLFLMYDFAIPLMYDNWNRKAGQVPMRPKTYTFFRNVVQEEVIPEAGWRRKFYPDIDFDVKLKLR